MKNDGNYWKKFISPYLLVWIETQYLHTYINALRLSLTRTTLFFFFFIFVWCMKYDRCVKTTFVNLLIGGPGVWMPARCFMRSLHIRLCQLMREFVRLDVGRLNWMDVTVWHTPNGIVQPMMKNNFFFFSYPIYIVDARWPLANKRNDFVDITMDIFRALVTMVRLWSHIIFFFVYLFYSFIYFGTKSM